MAIITALINDDSSITQLQDNIGVMVERAYYNQNITEKAVRATYPLFRYFNQDNIIITFEKENCSVKKACENMNGKQLDATVENEHKPKIRYVINCV